MIDDGHGNCVNGCIAIGCTCVPTDDVAFASVDGDDNIDASIETMYNELQALVKAWDDRGIPHTVIAGIITADGVAKGVACGFTLRQLMHNIVGAYAEKNGKL